MSVEVRLPEMGESVTEGTITRWLVAVGDEVAYDQPLVEISTDKVDAEIPSPVAGRVTEIRGAEGDVVPVDAVLVVITGESGEEGKVAKPAPAEATSPLVAATPPAPALAPPRPEAAAAPPARPPAAPPAPAPRAAAAGTRILATPVARSIAAERGLDLANIAGSGIRGRITRADVEAAAQAPPAAAAPKTAAGEFHVSAYQPGEDVTIEPMSRIRRLTSHHMSYSQATSVHVTTVFHVDFSRVVAARERAREDFQREHGTKLTYMPFLFKALVHALRAYPKFNASVDGDDIVYKNDIHLGMAVALETGLIVPVIHHADRLDLVGLAQRANDLAERARAKKLRPDEVLHGTFTVTNPGVYGSLFGTPIINQPQVAILCVGTIEKRVVVTTDADGDDSLTIRPMAYLALTYDHRLIDGADAELFMQDFQAALADDPWSEIGGG